MIRGSRSDGTRISLGFSMNVNNQTLHWDILVMSKKEKTGSTYCVEIFSQKKASTT